MNEQELYEAIWSGEINGFSETKLRESLAYDLAMLEDLKAGKIRPSNVIGTGYKGNTRKLATVYLLNSIADRHRDLESRGRTNGTNQANVKFHLNPANARYLANKVGA